MTTIDVGRWTMGRRSLGTYAAILLLAITSLPALSDTPQLTPGWRSDFLGPLRGALTVSLGAQAWDDHFNFRNLIARTTLDIAPGIRAHAIARRREGNWQRMPLHPDIDE